MGPFLQMPRYMTKIGRSFGGQTQRDLFFATGLAIRYAWAPRWSFLSELGYAGVVERGESAGGVLAFAGVEFREGLDTYATNQLFVGGGVGYERYGAGNDSVALNLLLARIRVGYRHVFGPSVALDLGLDGGPAYAFASTGGASTDVVLVGASFAFVVAF